MDQSATSQVQSSLPSPSPEKLEYTVSDFGSVRSLTKTVFWKWTVLDYSKWSKKVFDVSSPTFSTSSVDWCMTLCNTNNGELYLCFSVLSPNTSPMVNATVNVSMISGSGKKYEVLSNREVSVSSVQKAIWILLNNCFQKEDGLKDMFKIEGEVSINTVIVKPHMSEAAQQMFRTLPGDLGSLLESGHLSDIVLCAGDTKLKAHRAVLAARSPVFAAMLRHDTREAQTGTVNIPDVDPGTLQVLLRYIYTGDLQNMKEMTSKLLAAADKYDLPALKVQCEEHLAGTITVDNVVATAIFALTHDCDFLKKSVISFIKDNLIGVLGSDGWDKAVGESPAIIKELSRLVADKTPK